MLSPAPLETARFDLRTFRATVDRTNTADLFAQIRASNADLLILRAAPGTSSAIRQLTEYGLAPIHADTLVTYACDLQKLGNAGFTEDRFEIDVAQDKDRNAIEDLITVVFAEYPNHYTANPLLAREDIVAGYREWALSHLHGNNRVAWVARAKGRVVALACSAFDAATGECQGVLHGVRPEFGRAGIYTALIRYTQHYFSQLGCKRLTIQTQSWNMPVQRVWVREGFMLVAVHETFHVNALLDTDHGVVGQIPLDFGNQTDVQSQCTVLGSTIEAAGMHRAGAFGFCRDAALTKLIPTAFEGHRSLLVRVYDFARSCGQRLAVGMLRDADGNPVAITRVTANAP